MTKTLYITESQRRMLKESILMDALPEDIMNSVYKNKTSLGNNPAIPQIFENGYLEKIVSKAFNSAKDELKKIGQINDVSETSINAVLSKLVLKCQEIESNNRAELEKICYNYVVDLFSIPDDSVQMELALVDEVDLNDESIVVDPIYGDDDEYEDITEINSIRDEVYKRRMLDVLAMGAGMKLSSNIKSYVSDIYEINPQLPDLYRKILALNNYLLFTKEDFNITDENKQQMGTVVVYLGGKDEKVRIQAQGKIFPILLSETIRGFMDLFGSHGLPKDRNVMNAILSKADYLKAEPWDMRLGPSLWEILTDSFGDVDTDMVPYVYKRIAMLSPENFNKVLSEIFARTRRGKAYMGKIIGKAKEDSESDSFSDKMDMLKTDRSVITDEFIKEEEL